MNTEKLDIPEYEGRYSITPDGEITSHNYQRTGVSRTLVQSRNSHGYMHVGLRDGKRAKTFHVHRLVAITFMPNPEGYPQINHIDGNKENNSMTNLEWCTPAQNTRHAIETGLRNSCGEMSTQSKLTENEVIEILTCLKNNKSRGLKTRLAMKYGVSRPLIHYISVGIKWAYIDRGRI